MNKAERKERVTETLSKLLWEPRGWHQGARLKGGTPFAASGRHSLRMFKLQTREEINSLTGAAARGTT